MRVYFRGGAHPTRWDAFRAWGPTNARFDHHAPPSAVQQREILYAAATGLTCFAEVFQDGRIIDRSRNQPALVAFVTTRELVLLDLTGAWPTLAGASMNINSGPRPRAQRWSRCIYDAFPNIDGLYYPSSMHGNQPSVALCEPAKTAIPRAPSFNRLLSDPALLSVIRSAAHDIGYGLV